MRGSANYIVLIVDALSQNKDKKSTELQSQNWSWLKVSKHRTFGGSVISLHAFRMAPLRSVE